MTWQAQPFQDRRGLLMEQVSRGLTLVRGWSPEGVNPGFLYLTGIDEPRAVLLLAPGGIRVDTGRASPGRDYVRGRTVQSVLFLPAGDPLAARWGEDSRATSDAVSAEDVGVDAVYPSGGLDAVLATALRGAGVLNYVRGSRPSLAGGDDDDVNFLQRLRRRFFDLTLADATPWVDEMRRSKDAGEVAAIERSVAVTAEALDAAFAATRAGIVEHEVEAQIARVYRSHGGSHAFDPIVAAGSNALLLHYGENSGPIDAGSLLLLDTGVCIAGYRSDITRTIPVDGRFTARQREVYDVVLAALDASIAECKPGALLGDLHSVAFDVIDRAGHGEFFPHGLGHHLGLETHDVGDVHRPLQPGAVITIEPGVYIPDEAIGIRIEDDVLITETGCRVLSEAIPRSADAVERRMAELRGMSELPPGVVPAREPDPRESAAGVIVRRGSGGRNEVLLGMRSPKSRFMPGHLAFPGGGVDPVDRPDEPESYLRCVVRETDEETGVPIAPDAWFDAGVRVTPPLYPRRFRTRFFVAPMPQEGAELRPSPGEFESLEFHDPAKIVTAWRAGTARVPPPTLPILRVLRDHPEAEPTDLAVLIAEANALEERAPRIEFVPGLWVLPVRTATMPPATHTNVWIPGGRRFAVVDPGCTEPSEMARLEGVLERRAAGGDRPHVILLTHHHRDHVSGAAALAERLGIPVRAHQQVLDGLDGVPRERVGAPLADGEELDLDGVTLRVVRSPGHAPGHLTFHLPGCKAAIVGDLVSGMSTILIDALAGGDMQEYLDSVRRVARLDVRLLLPGHGPPLPRKALDRLVEHREQREVKILAALDSGVSDLAAVAARAYDELPDLPPALTGRQTLAHLVRLERLGRVRRLGPDSDRWQASGGSTSPSGGPGSPAPSTAERIERILRERFRPLHLELHDDSAKHVGHRGATSGGGHYGVVIESTEFEGLTLLEQHRLVNEALADLFGKDIHALAIRTSVPRGN